MTLKQLLFASAAAICVAVTLPPGPSHVADPNADWKGKGLWATYGTRTPFHTETGKGTRPKVAKFQLRPDPLAR